MAHITQGGELLMDIFGLTSTPGFQQFITITLVNIVFSITNLNISFFFGLIKLFLASEKEINNIDSNNTSQPSTFIIEG